MKLCIFLLSFVSFIAWGNQSIADTNKDITSGNSGDLGDVLISKDSSFMPWEKYCEEFIRKSPIEIQSSAIRKMRVVVNSIKLGYSSIEVKSVKLSPRNVVFYPQGYYGLNVDGRNYALEKFYFLAPSQFRFLGKSFPLELHFLYHAKTVYENSPQDLVLVVMFEEGAANPFVQKIIDQLSVKSQEGLMIDNDTTKTFIKLNSSDKLISDQVSNFYAFDDRLTNAEMCVNGVSWIVLDRKLTISKQQSKDMETMIGAKKALTPKEVEEILHPNEKEKKPTTDVKSQAKPVIYKAPVDFYNHDRLDIDPQYYNDVQNKSLFDSTLEEETKKLKSKQDAENKKKLEVNKKPKVEDLDSYKLQEKNRMQLNEDDLSE